MKTLCPAGPTGLLFSRFAGLRLILALALFAAYTPMGLALSKFERPIMMDANGGDVFVLDIAGTLHEFHAGNAGLEEFRQISLPATLTPADMSFALDNGEPNILIAGSQENRGIVMLYRLDGQSQRIWSFRNVCSGIDYSAHSHTAYVATSDSNEIYRIDVRKGMQSTFVARIPNATKLGPLAFDEANQTIYVADVAIGAIYQYSIATKMSKVLVSDLSAPTALSFDAGSGRLFVADPGRRAIVTVDTRSDNPVTLEFVAAPLKSPYAMALTSNDRLAVADYGSSSVIVFSNQGRLLFRFPATN